MTVSNNQVLNATHKTALRGYTKEQLRRRGKFQRQSARRRGLYVAAA